MMIRRFAAPAVALGLLAIVSATADAQAGAQTDARWRAWIGCWTPAKVEAGMGPTGTVCVIPTEKNSAVEILTVAGSTITDRMRVDADGVPHTIARDGCTGTETAYFSTSGTRVHIKEVTACEGGVKRTGSGIMSFDQTYQWLDVRGITSGTTAGVAVAKYQMLMDTTGLPAEARAVVASRGATANNALLAASAPLTLADIAEVSTGSDSGVAATWLVERTRGLMMNVNGKQLALLADQGVPASVIDVVVAIGHPRVFALAGSQSPQMREPQRNATTTVDNTYWRRYPSFYGGYASAFFDPWYGFYGGLYSPYSYRYGYGYSPYGYGYGYNPYYGGYYPGAQPIIVVNRPNDEPSRPHGRVTRSGGYSSGSGSSGSSAGSSGGSSSSSSGGSGSGSGSGSSGGSSAGSSAGSSGGGGRVAVPKPPTHN